MKVLFLCGVFGPQVENTLLKTAKKPIEYSANIFQQKLIAGFEAAGADMEIVSAPFVGSFPNTTSLVQFHSESYQDENYRYVSFNNIWGVRNISRAQALKKATASFAKAHDDQKLIVVYSPHTPFLEAAVHAKKTDPSIRICLVIPDLPQYMNLNARVSLVYKTAKKFDIARFDALNKYVDSYMLLTEEMKNKLAVGGKPYLVVEGIIDDIQCLTDMVKKEIPDRQKRERKIVYTGKTNEKFGIKQLVDAFGLIESGDYRLILCGKGDSDSYICEKAKTDPRIEIKGQVTPLVAAEYVAEADVLVNPRRNDEEYTKYSFPSKNIEYLVSGNPVVAHMLDGIPPVYRNFLHVPADDSAEALKNSIMEAAEASGQEIETRRNDAAKYLEKLIAENVANRLMDMNFEGSYLPS